jgi:hypothetical protein
MLSPAERLVIEFDPGKTTSEMTVRVSLDAGGDLRELLEAEGLDYGEVLELSQATEVLDTVATYLGAAGGGAGGFLLLRSAINKLIDKNKGKKISMKISGGVPEEFSAEGHSLRDINRFFKRLERRAKRNADPWKQIEQQRGGDDNRPTSGGQVDS